MKDHSPETAIAADVVTREESSGFCLDNPALESAGVRITQWRRDYVELELDVAPHMLNRSRVIHGGTLCTLLDAATGYSGLYAPAGEAPLHAVTLSLTSNFLSNGTGKLLTAKGMVDRRGRSIFFSRAEVWLDEALLVATGVATMKYLK
ncbi:PaaI family thioesterase [Cupriavidus yeoncheonensis]|nr:PaaI family thioesterase [Cupriavidus yeoncheonensis]